MRWLDLCVRRNLVIIFDGNIRGVVCFIAQPKDVRKMTLFSFKKPLKKLKIQGEPLQKFFLPKRVIFLTDSLLF